MYQNAEGFIAIILVNKNLQITSCLLGVTLNITVKIKH